MRSGVPVTLMNQTSVMFMSLFTLGRAVVFGCYSGQVDFALLTHLSRGVSTQDQRKLRPALGLAA